MHDIEIAEILAQYDAAEFSHADALAITEIPDRTLQVWYQRKHLEALGMTEPGRGNWRKYTLWQLMALSYVRRLAFLSIPVAEAVTIALAFAPIGQRPGRPVITVMAALEGAQDPSNCEEKVYSLIYRHMDGDWRHRIARIEELGSLTNWIATCAKDNIAVVCDLGRLTRIVLARAMDAQRRRAKGQ